MNGRSDSTLRMMELALGFAERNCAHGGLNNGNSL